MHLTRRLVDRELRMQRLRDLAQHYGASPDLAVEAYASYLEVLNTGDEAVSEETVFEMVKYDIEEGMYSWQ